MSGDVTAVSITNLTPGQTYYFSVAAYDTNDVIGPPSAELSYSVPGDSASVPGNVTVLPGAAPGSATIALEPRFQIRVSQRYLVSYGTMEAACPCPASMPARLHQ